MKVSHGVHLIACGLVLIVGSYKVYQPISVAVAKVQVQARIDATFPPAYYSINCDPPWNDDLPLRQPTRAIPLSAEAVAISGGPDWRLDRYLYPVDPWGTYSAIRSAAASKLMHGQLPQRVERHWPLPTRVTPTMKARYVPGAWQRR